MSKVFHFVLTGDGFMEVNVPPGNTFLESAYIDVLAEAARNKARSSLELGVFGLGLLEDRDIGVSIFP